MFVYEKEIKYTNVVLDKSFKFSIRIVKLYEYLINKNKNIEPLLKQLLRSGTSIGANITEAQSAYTKKDFINKLGISLKEARET
jgi:four helix bundle protein